MKLITRCSVGILFALSLLAGISLLFGYTMPAHAMPRPLATLPVAFAIEKTAAMTVAATLDEIDPGKPPLSIGTPVTDVVVVAAQLQPDDEPVVASFASPELQQIAAVENGEKPMLLQGSTVDEVVFASKQPTPGSARAVLQSQGQGRGENLALWYGLVQPFGQIGEPQPQINILGSVITPTGNISATFRLNGSAPRPLSLGPDTRRLARAGDFNVEVAYSELVTGTNEIVVMATDHISSTIVETVTVNYAPGNSWPLTYTTDWETANSIQDRAQVVDGEWALSNGTIRPVVLDYDRLVAIGDIGWSDYEVTVPVTIHAIDEDGFQRPSNGPGVGFLLRWQGHYQQLSEQPTTGWHNFGAIGWYRWGKDSTGATIAAQQMLAYQGREIAANPTKTPDFGVPYIMKMSVQSMAGKPAYYRFKAWRASEPEPATWDMEAAGRAGEPLSGSVVLAAHHVDATFGDVSIRPLSSLQPTLSISTDDNGVILVSPQKERYAYGELVELTATGNSGFAFNAWQGDVVGTSNPLTVRVTQDMSIAATFIVPQPATVTASANGNGTVKISPEKASYNFDELVAVTAVAAPGHRFIGWSGSATGLKNPLVFNIRENMDLTAAFGAGAPPVSDDFNSCQLDETLWTARDPKGDSTISMNGEQLLIAVPANSDHDLFEEKNFAPRLLQDVPNEDFIIEVKFDSLVSSRYQTQGIVIEQDTDNFLRLEYYHNGTSTFMYAAFFQDGQATVKANQAIVVPAESGSLYMRVTRAGNSWQQERSFDGLTWVTNATFDHTLTVANAGVYGGNVDPVPGGEDTSPAYTAVVDYFFNTASQIDPEDGQPLVPSTATVGSGSIAINPDKETYTCTEPIQLTATPAEGWSFSSWSGAVTGTTNPTTMTLAQGDSVTATFVQSQTLIYLPIVVR